MKFRFRLAALVLGAASVLLAGCAVPTAQSLSEDTWVAVAIDGVAAVVPAPPTLRWTDTGRVSGSGGCNQFSGKYTLEFDRMAFSALAATRMLCVPAPQGQEDKFFKALELTRRVQLADGGLLLLDEQGQPLIRMVKGSR